MSNLHRIFSIAKSAALIGLLILTVSPKTLPAQSEAPVCAPGQLRVFVFDTQQAAIADATVKLESSSKPVGERQTRSLGIADFETVPCGMASVKASKDGFDSGVTSIEIKAGASAETTVLLSVQMQRSSVEVKDSPPPVEQSASETTELRPSEVKTLPGNPPTVSEVLPLVPGVTRGQNGELRIDGVGEPRSALVVNQTDVTDPATGRFGQTVPIDAVETINVLNTPFLSQYGRFTAGVVAVETRRGGEKWHAELNDPFPDLRVRSYHLRGIRNETPRFFVGGPVIKEHLYFNTALQYFYQRNSSRTLPFPFNESKVESINSFSQLDWLVNAKQVVTATLHVSPQHTNFIDPNYFNPQPTTPSYVQHNYVGTVADHYSIFGGVVDTSFSFQRFGAYIGAQGDQEMYLSPTGNRGNYFGTQNRDARRTEWLETFSAAPVNFLGNHLVKFGSSTTWSGNEGQFTYRPVNILNTAGLLLERIDFQNRTTFNRTDFEITAYAQDHWALSPKFAFDYGIRIEHQELASSLRIAPRVGLAWTPFKNERTVFRAGYGEFYDHLPLDIYTFGRYPGRTITFYNPNGSILGSPIPFTNVIGSITGPTSYLVRGQIVAGAFSPRGATFNGQVEHSFSKLVRVRAVYTDNRSVGLVALDPELLGTANKIVLNGDGSSHYRQAEVTSKFSWKDGQQMTLSYVRSRARGTLNTFDTFLGNFPTPIIRSDVYSNLPADLPNRFLVWGRLNYPKFGLQIMPIVELRTGQPYIVLDAYQNYVGTPNSNSTRFPTFFSADARIAKDFKLNPKYTVRLSLSTFNITNHFNALALHSNITDPQYGIFFGNYHRRYRGDFEVVF